MNSELNAAKEKLEIVKERGEAALFKTVKEPRKKHRFEIYFRGRKIFNYMIYESKSGFIFEKCEFCQKPLNEMEKKFCDEKTVETGIFHQICSGCLDVKCNGSYPALA